jgi:hypothetical protein
MSENGSPAPSPTPAPAATSAPNSPDSSSPLDEVEQKTLDAGLAALRQAAQDSKTDPAREKFRRMSTEIKADLARKHPPPGFAKRIGQEMVDNLNRQFGKKTT